MQLHAERVQDWQAYLASKDTSSDAHMPAWASRYFSASDLAPSHFGLRKGAEMAFRNLPGNMHGMNINSFASEAWGGYGQQGHTSGRAVHRNLQESCSSKPLTNMLNVSSGNLSTPLMSAEGFDVGYVSVKVAFRGKVRGSTMTPTIF